ncbi:MAG: ATP-binding protein [Bacteriovoracaceae bacterium]|nr:ATP-binding protein [Bacteriovoracaceae bacterium]
MSISQRLLERQLKSVGLSKESLPTNQASWESFLAKINKAYDEADQDRYLLERSLSISSREMQERWNKLHSSEMRKNAIMISSIDSIISFNEQSKIIEFNPAAEQTFGLSRIKALNTNIRDLIDIKINENIFGDRIEYEAKKASGEAIQVETILTPIILEEEVIYSLFIRDLTEQKKSQKLINDQQIKLISSERLASLGRMASSIAHEINNPLSIMVLALGRLKKLIQRQVLTDEILLNALNDMEDMITRITKIINGLKTVSRDTKDFVKEQISMRLILEDVLSLCFERFKKSNIELRCDLKSKKFDKCIACDRVQFSQVLINLLSNGFDAVKNLRVKWVEIDIEKDDKFDIIKITDSGSGIPQAMQDQIFEPFFTTKDIRKGTGLGLSISRTIMEKHEGSIEIDQQSINTCFILKLPLIDQERV